MLILIKADFELERVEILNHYDNEDSDFDDIDFAFAEMSADIQLYKQYLKSEHYTDEEIESFFTETQYSVRCQAKNGDNVKWEIKKI